MKNNKSRAEIEFEFLERTEPNALVLEFKDEILALVNKFMDSGQSGGSAPYVASVISSAVSKLCMFETLVPLSGEDDEWTHLNYGDGLKYQNKRDSGVFKDADGTVTFNSAIVKRCPNGTCWTGPLYATREDAINNVNRIQVKVKSFPFTPKTFYIDVLEEEIEKDDWIMWVKDPKQLEEVLNYYDLQQS